MLSVCHRYGLLCNIILLPNTEADIHDNAVVS